MSRVHRGQNKASSHCLKIKYVLVVIVSARGIGITNRIVCKMMVWLISFPLN
jgi:hypothetical protein